ncbi:MAG: nucleotidyltransferase domain-containing protein [Nanoarchaeota archaeon]
MVDIEINILTKKENEVLNKKLNNKKLTQVESNYLSRSIRHKLRKLGKLKEVNIDLILQRIEYNQNGLSIENKIKKLIGGIIKELDSIIIYGSAIQTNYHSYNDIDVLVLTKKKIWSTLKEKYNLIKTIKEKAKDININLDIQIMQKQEFYIEYPSSPSLIYQLKDNKVIYGKIKIPNKTSLHNIDLKMKLDWSNIEDIEPKGVEIYTALRNVILVRLLLNKIVDNQKLKESLNNEIGKSLIERLKNNKESKTERKIALNYLKELIKTTREEIRGDLWEKIEL